MRRYTGKSKAQSTAFMGTLFDMGEAEVAPKPILEIMARIIWSYSRRGKLEQCPLHYYNKYYGHKKALADKEPLQPLLSQLTQLQNRHQRVGKILHQVIATYFRKAQAGEVWSIDRLVDWARVIFRADIKYSRSDPQGNNPVEGRYPPNLLQEFYYEFTNAEQLCIQAEGRLISALRNFALHPAYEHLRFVGVQPGTLIEEHLTIKNLPCRVKGVVDLLFCEGQALHIVDWKIGEAGVEGDDSLQLAVYALWARERFQRDSKDISVFKAYLGSGDLVPFRATSEVLAAASARVLQDAERMAYMDSYGEQGIREAFTPRAEPNICRLCPFLQAREEGRNCLNV